MNTALQLIPVFMFLAGGGAVVWACMAWLHNRDRRQWLDDVTYRRSNRW